MSDIAAFHRDLAALRAKYEGVRFGVTVNVYCDILDKFFPTDLDHERDCLVERINECLAATSVYLYGNVLPEDQAHDRSDRDEHGTWNKAQTGVS